MFNLTNYLQKKAWIEDQILSDNGSPKANFGESLFTNVEC